MHFSHIRIGTSPPTLKLRLYAGSYLCPLSDVRRSREDYIGTPVKSGDFGGKSFLVKKSKKNTIVTHNNNLFFVKISVK
jgi:hypothetical protein